jgi:elongation factor P--(R)-beta-lysine ligase
MSDADHWRPSASPETLRLRAQLNAHLRAHFATHGVLEVETPMLSAAGVTDPHIASFTLAFDGPVAGGSRQRWLRTSPEFALKRLLAAGAGDCYELGRVFRNGEAGGRHNPEFTMLEWYRVGWDHLRLMEEVGALVQSSLALVGRSLRIQRIRYRDLFLDTLALDPLRASIEALCAPLTPFRIDPAGLTRDDWLDLLLTHLIQPQFAPDQLLLLHDYPASQCALARVRGEGAEAVAERFEAFIGPLELANGYHELVDAAEQARRFERDHARRAELGLPRPDIDQRLLAALQHGMPACAGVALGVDRLLAAMVGSDRLDAVLAFPFARA